MTTGTLIWLIIYTVASFTFFSAAIVITFFGVRDLKDLITGAKRTER